MVRLASCAGRQFASRITTRLIQPTRFSVPCPSTRSFATSRYLMDGLASHSFRTGADDAIARSKNSSDVQTITPELPEVPRIPTKRRTFHLTREDLETYVQPLLAYHWHVGRIGDGVDGLEVFSLNKLFSFTHFRSAIEFFDALADIQDEECHHARITVDYANVYVSTHTHVAYQRASEGDPIRVPGLTSRDVRFAVKVDQLHNTFLVDKRAVTKVPVEFASLQAWSMEQLQRRYGA